MNKIILPKEERKALVVLHSDASHGPWAYESDGDSGNFNVGIVLGNDDKPISGYVEDNTCTVVDVVAREVEGSPNAAFIVEAYNIFPRLLYSLEMFEASTEKAEAEIERLRRIVLAQEDYMQSTVNAIFEADITDIQKHNILNNKQRISTAVTCILARNAGSSQIYASGTPCPICGGSGHIGDCEED